MNTLVKNYPLTLLYDGACPVCNLEMDNLKYRNTDGQLAFIDISARGFDPAAYGATLADVNALIHAVRPDGSLVIGVEVFRLAYGAVGLGHLTAPTAWPELKTAVDVAYAVFARNRYRFSRAFTPLLEALRNARATRRAPHTEAAAQAAAEKAGACRRGQCAVPAQSTVIQGDAS